VAYHSPSGPGLDVNGAMFNSNVICHWLTGVFVNWTERQTEIDISGSIFPKFRDASGKPTERFWYVKDEFIRHAQSLFEEGKAFSQIEARLEGNRWVCVGKAVASSDVASLVWKLRLFYLKSESMSIHSLCTYLEGNIANENVQRFFKHMRNSWERELGRRVPLLKFYSGSIKTNKQLIDALLYSGNFHSQEKQKKRYDELLEYMDESLILMSAYNAMHNGYQMNQISRALSTLQEDNFVILLPDHLRHEWDKNCPYTVQR